MGYHCKIKILQLIKLRSTSGAGLLKYPASKEKLSDIFELRACLHEGGGPQVGEVTSLGGVTRLSTQFPTRPGIPQLHVDRP